MIGYWNSEEDDALQHLPLRAQVIYLRGIRRFADANGIAGLKRKISWKSLSEVAEVVPGRGSHSRIDVPSRKAVRCAIEQLEKAEIIKQLPDSERFKGLVFKCLLVDEDQSAPTRKGQGGAKEGPSDEGPKKNRDLMRDSDGGRAKEGPSQNDIMLNDEGPASPSPSPNTTTAPHRARGRAHEDDTPQDQTPPTSQDFQDSTIPQRPAQWEQFFQRERGYPLHILMTVKTIPLFKRWCDDKLTCGLLREAMQIAEAKLGRVPDSPMYYQNFVTDLRLSYERANKNPAGDATSTPGEARPQQPRSNRTHEKHNRPLGRGERNARQFTEQLEALERALAEEAQAELDRGAMDETSCDLRSEMGRLLPFRNR